MLKYRLITKKEMDRIKQEGFKNMTSKQLEKTLSNFYFMYNSSQHKNKYYEACILYIEELLPKKVMQENITRCKNKSR